MPRKNPGESKEEPTRKLVGMPMPKKRIGVIHNIDTPKKRIGGLRKKVDSKAGERREAGPATPATPATPKSVPWKKKK